MSHARSVNSRSLTVVLSESDWRALREVEPDAVGWLRERIRERIGAKSSADGSASGPRGAVPAPSWNDDQY